MFIFYVKFVLVLQKESENLLILKESLNKPQSVVFLVFYF